MSSQKSALLGMAGAILLSATCTMATGQTLKDAVSLAVQNNPDVLIEARHRLSTDEAVKVARGGYFPRIDLLLGTGRERSDNSTTQADVGGWRSLHRREGQLTLTQMLFDGFGVSSEVARNRARVESAAHKVAGTADQVGLNAVEVFIEVLRNQELVRLTQDNVAAHERTYDQIRMRSDSGVGRKSDQDQIEARLALAKANLSAAQANLKEAEYRFQRVIGVAPGTLTLPTERAMDFLPSTVDETVQQAVDNHPILKSARADVKAAEAQLNAAKSFMYPRFDLELGYGRNRNLDGVPGDNDERFAMLRMRYNIFRGGSDSARIAEYHELVSQAEAVALRTRQQVEESTRLSWNALQAARNRLPSLKQHAESSQLTREAYAKQFSIGQRTLLDLLDTENEYFTSSTDLIDGTYVEIFAQYRLAADLARVLDVVGVPPRPEAALAAE